MMKNISLVFPNGDTMQGGDVETILAKIASMSNRDWNAGSGQLAIEIDGGSEGVLALTRGESKRFLLSHAAAYGEPEYAVSQGSTEADLKETLYIGGEPAQIPDHLLVDMNTVNECVIRFLQSNERNPAYSWVVLSEQNLG